MCNTPGFGLTERKLLFLLLNANLWCLKLTGLSPYLIEIPTHLHMENSA